MSDQVAQAVAVEDVADAAALSSDLGTSEAGTELGAECAPIICNFASLTRQRGGEAAMIMKQGARTDLAQIRAMSQRAMIAARMANMQKGWQNNASIEALSQPEAAAKVGVSRSTVQRAAKVLTTAPQAVVEAVERGQRANQMLESEHLDAVSQTEAAKMANMSRGASLQMLL
jgi:hypothetical protein